MLGRGQSWTLPDGESLIPTFINCVSCKMADGETQAAAAAVVEDVAYTRRKFSRPSRWLLEERIEIS